MCAVRRVPSGFSNIIFHDGNKEFIYAMSKCRSCAYHTALTDDEIDMERDMRMLRPERHHACHERSNTWCVGSVETQKLFE